MRRSIRLGVLGSLDLRDPEERVVSSILSQPRRTALFAYLVLAQPRAYHRRDSLIAIFWPESTERAARDLLNTNLSRLRASLGGAVLVSRGSEEVAIDHQRLWCDALAFEDAARAGKMEEALALYGGDLLEGFHIAAAPAFERWLAEERTRLRELAAGVAWSAADLTARVGEAERTRDYVRRAASLSASNEAGMRRGMDLLESIGDRAGALQLYDALVRHLREEFDAEPSAATRILSDRLRLAARRSTIGTQPVGRTEGTRPLVHSRKWRAGLVATLAIVAVTSFVSMALLASTRRVVDKPTADRVAVFPFATSGAAAGYLAEGMTDLLSAKLAGVEGLQPLNPRAVLKRMAPSLGTKLTGSEAERAAADLGANLYVVGTGFQVDRRVRLDAALYDRRVGPQPVSTASVEGEAAAMFDLVDRLARGLLAGRYDESRQRLSRIGAETTHSIEALKSYLAGEQHYRHANYESAIDAFQQATRIDSTFALAHYRLSNAAAWVGSDSVSRAAADHALALSGTVPITEAKLIDAWHGYVYGEGERAERIYREVVTSRPSDAEAWYRFAEVLFHYGPTLGTPLREAEEAFEKLLKLEPDNLEAVVHLARLAAVHGRTARLDSLAARAQALRPARAETLELLQLRALLRRDRRLQNIVRDSMALADGFLTHWLVRAAIAFNENLDAADELGLERRAAGSEPQAVEARVLLAHVRLGQGRWNAAKAELDRLAAVAPALALEQRAVLATLPFMRTDPAELQALLASFATPAGITPGYAAPGQLSLQPPWTGAYAQGLLYASIGDVGAARRVASELERHLPKTATLRDDTLIAALRQQLARGIRVRALARAGDHGSALRTLGPARLPSLRVLPSIMQHPTAAERYLRAQILRELGRDQEALAWLATFPDPSGYDVAYLAPAHFMRAEIHAAAGDRQAAMRHYGRAADLWRNADARLRPLADSARDRYAQLERIR